MKEDNAHVHFNVEFMLHQGWQGRAHNFYESSHPFVNVYLETMGTYFCIEL